MLKPGQTINIAGRWGTVTYLIGDDAAVVTLDDDAQVQAALADITVPATLRSGRKLKSFGELPADLAEEARLRYACGSRKVAILSWLWTMGYDVQSNHLGRLLGKPDTES